MKVSEPRLIIEMFRAGLAGASIMPESEVAESGSRDYRIFAIEQQVKLFCPAIVTLHTEKDTFLPEQ